MEPVPRREDRLPRARCRKRAVYFDFTERLPDFDAAMTRGRRRSSFGGRKVGAVCRGGDAKPAAQRSPSVRTRIGLNSPAVESRRATTPRCVLLTRQADVACATVATEGLSVVNATMMPTSLPPKAEYLVKDDWTFIECPSLDAGTVRVQAIIEYFEDKRDKRRRSVLWPSTLGQVLGRHVDIPEHRKAMAKAGFPCGATGANLSWLKAVRRVRSKSSAPSPQTAGGRAGTSKLDTRLFFARELSDEAVRVWYVAERRWERARAALGFTRLSEIAGFAGMNSRRVRAAILELARCRLAFDNKVVPIKGVVAFRPITDGLVGKLGVVEFTSEELGITRPSSIKRASLPTAESKKAAKIADRRRRSREPALAAT